MTSPICFLPTLKFKLQGIYDEDLILREDLNTSTYSGKIELKYNIFNGLSDKKRTQREELFLKESQLKLDSTSKSVIDNLNVAYNTYHSSKSQIKELKQFIEENKLPIEIIHAVENPPMETDSNNPFIKSILAAHPSSTCVGAPWFSDAAHLSSAGIPSICAGPGSIDQAHTKDEWIKVEDLEAGVDFFEAIITADFG